ncbi:MAG: GntR family transcriptional regulator [Thermoanaerobacteraceae bacterium]|nr:GntR family transcriptional regulator [Thermoanaerobacteraceae bacterium]
MLKLIRNTLQNQAIDLLLRMIKNGYFLSNRLPSEEELAETMGISRGTLREALHSLVKMGIVTKKQGKGTFFHRSIANLDGRLDLGTDFIQILESQGGTIRVEQTQPVKKPASARAKARLLLGPEDMVWGFDWLYYKNEDPTILAEIEIPCKYFWGPDWRQVPSRTLKEYYELHCEGELVKMVTWLKSGTYDKAAKIFQKESSAPLMWWEEVWYTLEDTPACYVDVYFNPEQVELALVVSLQ